MMIWDHVSWVLYTTSCNLIKCVRKMKQRNEKDDAYVNMEK